MRNGQSQPVTFKDQEGNQWFAYYAAIENGWGLIAQQQVAEIDRDIDLIAGIAWVVVPVGAVILMILIWLAIRQTVKPINALTETVTALARGDLNRTAPVTSEDEIGTLAKAFNTMTLQLRDLVGSLEVGLAGHPTAPVLGQAGVQDMIGNGIANLVGMTFADRLGGKDEVLAHDAWGRTRGWQILILTYQDLKI